MVCMLVTGMVMMSFGVIMVMMTMGSLCYKFRLNLTPELDDTYIA
jgi:hypothetical protein